MSTLFDIEIFDLLIKRFLRTSDYAFLLLSDLMVDVRETLCESEYILDY